MLEIKDDLTITISLLSVIVSFLSVIVSFCAYKNTEKQNKKQIKHQEKSNDLSALNVVTQLQIEISKKQLSLIDLEVTTSAESELKLKAKIEDLLNLFELLSIYILKSDLDENMMKVIYKEVIIQTVKENKEYFEIDTKYRNLKKLYDNWTADREIT